MYLHIIITVWPCRCNLTCTDTDKKWFCINCNHISSKPDWQVNYSCTGGTARRKIDSHIYKWLSWIMRTEYLWRLQLFAVWNNQKLKYEDPSIGTA